MTSARRLLLFSLLAIPLSAQTFDATALGPAAIDLSGTWKYHAGDNPRWADPHWNDADWQDFSVPHRWTVEESRKYHGVGWLRAHVRLPQRTAEPLGLLMRQFGPAYEVYWSGKRVGNFGSLPPHERIILPQWQEFGFTGHGSGPEEVLALRVLFSVPMVTLSESGDVLDSPAFGWNSVLRDRWQAYRDEAHFTQLPMYLLSLLCLLAGAGLLIFYRSQRDQTAYLWCAVYLIATALDWLETTLFSTTTLLTYTPFTISDDIWVGATLLALLRFIHAYLGVPLSPVARVLQYLYFGSLGGLFLSLATQETVLQPILFLIICLPFATCLVLLIRCAWQGQPEARTLLPVGAIYLVSNLVWLIVAALVFWRAIPANLFSDVSPVQFLATVLFLFTIGYLLVRRFTRIRDEQERLSREVEAAQAVQRLLLPAIPPATPGFQVESVYLPAQELGGDFFQVAPGPDGSLLLLVGDVSGKGLKAAMFVSLVIGAWQNRQSSRPAQLLRELNIALLGRIEGGFATCCCARLESDGTMLLANAGHLAPYRGEVELEVPAGLPLGIADEAGWDEAGFTLSPGERLVFVSDGVLEARNGRGELLGFERLQKLARYSAQQIASIAREFGQEDDITVVQVQKTQAAAVGS